MKAGAVRVRQGRGWGCVSQAVEVCTPQPLKGGPLRGHEKQLGPAAHRRRSHQTPAPGGSLNPPLRRPARGGGRGHGAVRHAQQCRQQRQRQPLFTMSAQHDRKGRVTMVHLACSLAAAKGRGTRICEPAEPIHDDVGTTAPYSQPRDGAQAMGPAGEQKCACTTVHWPTRGFGALTCYVHTSAITCGCSLRMTARRAGRLQKVRDVPVWIYGTPEARS